MRFVFILFLFLYCAGIHAQKTIIVKFNYKYLDYAFIDDKEQLSTYFDQLFNEEAEEEISILLSKYPALMNSGVAKIFHFLTTEDSVSISRHGHRVTIPPFWAAFNLEIPEAYKAREIIAFLDDFQPLVEYAHESFKVVPQNTPNDQFYFRQEGLADPAGLADINVEQAWAIETGKKFVKVGVHDNGIDSLNPDIDVLTGRDYFANQGATNWGTESYGIPHGTQVAGIIGAKRNNTIGIAGIAGGDGSDSTGCSLIDFKYPFLSSSNASYMLASIVDAARSPGTYFEYGDAYHNGAANDYYFNSAKGFGIHIGNHSYVIKSTLPMSSIEKVPGSGSSGVIEVSSCALCREAYLFSLQNGVINVVARGNSGQELNNDPTTVEDLTPQNLPDGWILSVGASGYDGNTVEEGVNQSVEEVSNNFYSLYGGNMDLVAPGSDSIVFSTLATHVTDQAGQPLLYRSFNGTSAAAPHVAGVAALLLSHYNRPCYSNQNLTIEDVEYLLEESATDLFTPGFDQKSGAGRLNAGAALNMIGEPTRQIVHPDSLIASDIVRRDTIALAYNKAFVQDGWGPISQNIPLEQEREYKVERVYVENTYSFAHFTTPNTIILDSWACPSISNSVGFYRDTIETVILSQGGIPNDGYIFQLFDRDPFDTIVNIDTLNKEIVVGGYFYKFLRIYNNVPLNISNSQSEGYTLNNFFELPNGALNVWYPFNPEIRSPRMITSLYLEDASFTTQFFSACDSINELVDDTLITNPLSINAYNSNDFIALIYPNPSDQFVNIQLSDASKVYTIEVYSSLGQKILSHHTNGKGLVSVNVKDWANGIYHFKCIGDSFYSTHKFSKQ